MRRIVLWIVAAVGALLVLAAIFFPVLHSTDQGGAPRKACLSNVKQIINAFAIYIADSDDHLPAKGWWPELKPYVKNEDMLTCPFVLREKKRYGYAMNVALLGMDAHKIKDPERTVLMFETDALGLGVVANLAARNVDRHNGKSSVVGYADTHARSVPKGASP